MDNKTLLATICILADKHGFVAPGNGTHTEQETHKRAVQVLAEDIQVIDEYLTQADEIFNTVLGLHQTSPYVGKVQNAISTADYQPVLMGSAYLMAQRSREGLAVDAWPAPNGEYFGEVGDKVTGEFKAIVEFCHTHYGDYGASHFNRLILETGETLTWVTSTWQGTVGETVDIVYFRVKGHQYNTHIGRDVTAVTHVKFKVG